MTWRELYEAPKRTLGREYPPDLQGCTLRTDRRRGEPRWLTWETRWVDAYHGSWQTRPARWVVDHYRDHLIERKR